MPLNDLFDDNDSNAFEQRLKEFQPTVPARLNIGTRERNRHAFAVAAILLFTAALILVPYAQRHESAGNPIPIRAAIPENPPLTALQLRVALLAGEDQFDQLLDEANSSILPRGQSGTVLYELGKE